MRLAESGGVDLGQLKQSWVGFDYGVIWVALSKLKLGRVSWVCAGTPALG